MYTCVYVYTNTYMYIYIYTHLQYVTLHYIVCIKLCGIVFGKRDCMHHHLLEVVIDANATT